MVPENFVLQEDRLGSYLDEPGEPEENERRGKSYSSYPPNCVFIIKKKENKKAM